MAGQDVLAEDDELKLLEALRRQVQLRAAARYNAAADIAADHSGVSAADRAYQSMLMNRGERCWGCSRAVACMHTGADSASVCQDCGNSTCCMQEMCTHLLLCGCCVP